MKPCVLLFALVALAACAPEPQPILEAGRPSWDRCALLAGCDASADTPDTTTDDASAEQ